MILNYNGCKLLNFTQKIEEPLSNIIKVFNKTISPKKKKTKKKQKSHNTKSMIQLYINFFYNKDKRKC